VLSGVPPDAAFDDPEEFAAAAERAPGEAITSGVRRRIG